MMRDVIKKEWTRALVYILLITFGVYSTVYPLISLESSTPRWIPILLGSEFAIAGVCLFIGMGRRKSFRLIGLLVISIGLFTISGVIATVGGTRVLAYAFLFAAFAMDSVHDIRMERRSRQRPVDPIELKSLLDELQEAANPEGTQP